MYNPIEIRKRHIQNQIRKSFSVDIEKAVAAIGEVRHWEDGDYKKVESGKWVRVSDGKKVTDKNMINVLSSASERLKRELYEMQDAARQEYRKTAKRSVVDSKFFESFFQSVWRKDEKNVKIADEIGEQQVDIAKEIAEIKTQIAISQKRKREDKAGKKELDDDDVRDFCLTASRIFNDVRKEVPVYISAAEVAPKVTIKNYFLDTEADFQNVFGKEVVEDFKTLEDKWRELKKRKGFQFHESPKSGSEYLYDKSTGDIYRFSDHWGKVASCRWYIDNETEYGWDIAKCNIKDFKRRKEAEWFNPAYTKTCVKAAKKVLPKIKEYLTENADFYLTNKARMRINETLNGIWKGLQATAYLSLDEIEKLKKKYELI